MFVYTFIFASILFCLCIYIHLSKTDGVIRNIDKVLVHLACIPSYVHSGDGQGGTRGHETRGYWWNIHERERGQDTEMRVMGTGGLSVSESVSVWGLEWEWGGRRSEWITRVSLWWTGVSEWVSGVIVDWNSGLNEARERGITIPISLLCICKIICLYTKSFILSLFLLHFFPPYLTVIFLFPSRH